MFYANDTYGQKTHIEDAEPKQAYFCPACGATMVQKRGRINAHHFAHKVGKECDPWYTGKLSSWHVKMQNHFKKDVQEVVIWNATHTKYHIADVLLQGHDKKYVVEFQHSPISQSEFLTRSQFYIECGYTIIWVFDFCECTPPKRIFISDVGYEENLIRLTWPGKDRVRFLDGINVSDFNNHLHISFHINTGMGELRLQTPNGYIPWERWEYKNPFSRYPCFVLLYPDYFNGVNNFFAWQYSEQDFLSMLRRVIE